MSIRCNAHDPKVTKGGTATMYIDEACVMPKSTQQLKTPMLHAQPSIRPSLQCPSSSVHVPSCFLIGHRLVVF